MYVQHEHTAAPCECVVRSTLQWMKPVTKWHTNCVVKNILVNLRLAGLQIKWPESGHVQVRNYPQIAVINSSKCNIIW